IVGLNDGSILGVKVVSISCDSRHARALGFSSLVPTFWAILSHDRAFPLIRISMTMYDSWRNKMSRIIGRCLIQEAEVCWAIALIRQFEALSKIDKSLDLDQALSIQELINNIPKQFIEDDGTLLDMVHAKDPLWTYGTVLEHVCPLTYALNITGSSPEPAVRYMINEMTIHYLDTY
ncbi:unnamed protein product, partial [Arabidopsis halleri]